jgi:mRNA-degrading endonuclease RelE of RelBE toxin-antitoxin system
MHGLMPLLVPLRVEKQLEAMPQAERTRLLERLKMIAAAPKAHHPNVLPLVGRSGVFRVRQEDWRALFRIEDTDVVVIRVAHRREVYE